MRKIHFILVLLIVFTLALSGCGSDAPEQASPTSPVSSEPTSTDPAPSTEVSATAISSQAPTTAESSPHDDAATENRFTITGIDVAGMMSAISNRNTITLIGVLEDGTEVSSSGDPKTWFSNAEITDLTMPKDTPVSLEEKDGGLWFLYLIEKGKHLEGTILCDGSAYNLDFTDGLSFSCIVEDDVAKLIFDPALCAD